MDTDEEFAGELEGLDISAAKEKIQGLQAERERRREAIERLQEKLKALNYELAARKEEAERHKKRWQDQVERNKQNHEAGAVVAAGAGDFSDTEVDDVRRLVEQTLGNAVPTPAERNDLGIRLFNERDLMVMRTPDGPGGAEGQSLRVDTVLITHYRSASAEQKYHLSYRVGRHTTARKLREDACAYWGISEVEYILWTMNNCKVQDDLRIQNLFKPQEEAHIILAPKTPKKVEPPERISDLIRAKHGPKARPVGRRKQAAAGQPADGAAATAAAMDEARKKPGNFYEQMAEIRGLFEFMIQRDRNPKVHIRRIRCGSLFLYGFLAIMTLVSLLFAKPPDKEYFVRHGVFDSVANTGPIPFNDVRTTEEVWDWLQAVLPDQIFSNTSALRLSNIMLGSVVVWMQQVKNASASNCEERVPGGRGIECFAEHYDQSTAGTEDLEDLKAYWTPLEGVDGRVNGTLPWKYANASAGWEAGAFDEKGQLDNYDSTGYVLAYDLREDAATVRDAVVQDLEELKGLDWINIRTRAVHVTFALYNQNFDYWVTSWYIFEFPATGIVWPFYQSGAYRPILDSVSRVGVAHFGLDVVRFVFVVFCLCCEMSWQATLKAKKTKEKKERENKHGPGVCMSLMLYFLSWRGILDCGILAGFLAVFFMRYVAGPLHTLAGTTPELRAAKLHEMDAWSVQEFTNNHMIIEACVFAFCALRVLSLLQLNRHIYVVFKAIGSAAPRYCRFLLVLSPVVVGFIALAQTVWRAYALRYRTFWSAWSSTFMCLSGDKYSLFVDSATRPATTIYMLVFYSFLFLMCVNLWTAVLVNEYQEVRVAAGFRPKDYRWKEYDYVDWLFPRLLKKGYLKLRPNIRPPSDDEEEEPQSRKI